MNSLKYSNVRLIFAFGVNVVIPPILYIMLCQLSGFIVENYTHSVAASLIKALILCLDELLYILPIASLFILAQIVVIRWIGLSFKLAVVFGQLPTIIYFVLGYIVYPTFGFEFLRISGILLLGISVVQILILKIGRNDGLSNQMFAKVKLTNLNDGERDESDRKRYNNIIWYKTNIALVIFLSFGALGVAFLIDKAFRKYSDLNSLPNKSEILRLAIDSSINFAKETGADTIWLDKSFPFDLVFDANMYANVVSPRIVLIDGDSLFRADTTWKKYRYLSHGMIRVESISRIGNMISVQTIVFHAMLGGKCFTVELWKLGTHYKFSRIFETCIS